MRRKLVWYGLKAPAKCAFGRSKLKQMASIIFCDSCSQRLKCLRITLRNVGCDAGQGVAPENGSYDNAAAFISGPISKISFLSRRFFVNSRSKKPQGFSLVLFRTRFSGRGNSKNAATASQTFYMGTFNSVIDDLKKTPISASVSDFVCYP